MKNGETTNAGATFTGAAQRSGKVLLVTVMHPAKREHNQVYKETAKLLDWGFRADGKVTPVGELVAPQSALRSGTPSSEPGATAGSGSAGLSTAAAMVGGALAVFGLAAYLIRRRWPQ